MIWMLPHIAAYILLYLTNLESSKSGSTNKDTDKGVYTHAIDTQYYWRRTSFTGLGFRLKFNACAASSRTCIVPLSTFVRGHNAVELSESSRGDPQGLTLGGIQITWQVNMLGAYLSFRKHSTRYGRHSQGSSLAHGDILPPFLRPANQSWKDDIVHVLLFVVKSTLMETLSLS